MTDGPGAVSFDLFETLVTVEPVDDPADAIATELARRDVPVPDDWHDRYHEPHVTVPEGRELSLVEHTIAILSTQLADDEIHLPREDIESAVLAAFDTCVRTPPEALEAVRQVGNEIPTGILSNCSVPSLASRVLDASELDCGSFDAVVTSVDCGWRKPHPNAFEAVATRLDVPVEALLHVGDDPRTDGGAESAGARSTIVAGPTDLLEVTAGRWG